MSERKRDGISTAKILMKTIADMVYAEGREEGTRTGTIDSIFTLLGVRFQSDAVQALRPTLEAIDDLSRLKELLIAASNAQSVEAFAQTLHDRDL